jgi:probable HAF family extracellular repeat protein
VIHGFIDRHGRYTTFNDPNAGTKAGQGTGASAISNLGLIVGIYFDGSGTVHGFTFTPAR